MNICTREHATFGAIIFFILLMLGAMIRVIMLNVYAQGEEKQPTGYFVKVEALNVPDDITATPIGTFVLYDKSGIKEVWRENVSLGTYESDIQLETAIDDWALSYIEKYERKVALSSLAKTSKIISVKIGHKK